jgi:hypothetical protein
MRLYISNFDGAPVAKAVAAGALLIFIAWAITPSKLAFDETPILGAEPASELVVEQYTYEHQRKPIVLVGSSIQIGIPPVFCRPENVATIYLWGRSGQSGLEAIIRTGARPELVFVETLQLAGIADPELKDAVFKPIYWWIRTLIPPLRYNRNWFVLLNRKFIKRDPVEAKGPTFPLELPPMSLDEWDKEVLHPESWPYFREVNNDNNIRIGMEHLVPLVRTIQQRGARVIMYNPADPRLTKISPGKDLTAAIRAALPM